jgi:hypothetical protein
MLGDAKNKNLPLTYKKSYGKMPLREKSQHGVGQVDNGQEAI